MKSCYKLFCGTELPSVVAFLFIAFAFYSAEAQVEVPFSPRSPITDPDKKIFRVKGDFVMIGNTNMTRSSSCYTSQGPQTNSYCMEYVDVDGDPGTVNSSSCELKFANGSGENGKCANILFAGLYWTGKWRSFPRTVYDNGLPEASKYTVRIERIHYDHWSHDRTFRYTFTSRIDPNLQTVIDLQYSHSYNRVTVFVPGAVVGTQSGTSYDFGGAPITLDDGTYRLEIKYLSIDRKRYDVAYADVSYSKLLNRRVKLKHENEDAYRQYSALPGDIYFPQGDPTGNLPFSGMYVGYCDVTEYVKAHGVGNYTVADVACKDMGYREYDPLGMFGGWTMIVIYDDKSSPSTKWRDIVVMDGYAHVHKALGNLYIPISGFKAVENGPVNVNIGLFASEGDRGISGDRFAMQTTGGAYNHLSSAQNAVDNFFNSTAEVDGTRNPAYFNLRGVDIHKFALNNSAKNYVTNGQTSTQFRATSSQDTYVISVLVVAIDAWIPEPDVVQAPVSIQKQGTGPIIPEEGGDFGIVEPGDILEFSITVKNIGEPLSNDTIKIPMPSLGEYVSHTATINGSVDNNSAQYKADMGANGTLVWNLGNIPQTQLDGSAYGTLRYRIRVSSNCVLWANNCKQRVSIRPVFSGTGSNSNVSVSNESITIGYNTQGGCNSHITGEYSKEIEVSIISESCAGIDPVQTFSYCNYPGATIPVADVRGHFPPGYRFFNKADYTASDAVQYTSSNGFPNEQGIKTYYAVPSNDKDCMLTFKLDVTTITTTPGTANVSYCQNAEASPLTATPNNAGYRLFFYESATGSGSQTSLIPSTAEVGTKTYWVAEGKSSTCLSPNRAPLVVTVTENPVLSVSVAQQACSSTEGGRFTFTASGGTGTLVRTYGETTPPTAPFTSVTTFPGTADGKAYYFRATDTKGCFAETTVKMVAPETPLILTANTTHACQPGGDGSITLSASGGYGNYVYFEQGKPTQLSPIFTLSGGNHVMFVKDEKGCETTTNVFINSPQQELSIELTSENDCDNNPATGSGAIHSVVTGGKEPYTYTWKKNGGEEILSTGSEVANLKGSVSGEEYTLKVTDALGCEKTVTRRIYASETPLTLQTNASSVLYVCDVLATTAEVVLSAGGGATGGYQYRKGEGSYQNTGTFSNLAAGNHFFTVKDSHGCEKDLTVVVERPADHEVSLAISSFKHACIGNNGAVVLSGNDGYGGLQYSKDGTSYTSENTFEGLAAGTHTFYVKDARGCVNTQTQTLEAPPAPLTIASADVYGNCNPVTYDGRVQLHVTGGKEPLQYSYSYANSGGAIQEVLDAANPTEQLEGSPAGRDYTFKVTDALQCSESMVATIYSPANSITAGVRYPVIHQCTEENKGLLVVEVANGTGPYTVQMSSDGGLSYGEKLPVSGGEITFDNLDGSPDGKLYRFKVEDKAHCTTEVEKKIYKNTTPVSLATSSNSPVCTVDGEPAITLSVTGGFGNDNFVYAVQRGADMHRSPQTGRTHTFDAGLTGSPEGMDYRAQVSDSIGCIDTAWVKVHKTNHTLQSLGLTVSNDCSRDGSGVFSMRGSGGVGSKTYVLTSNGTSIGTGTVETSVIKIDNLQGDTGAGKEYLIEVTDGIGCTLSETFRVKKPETKLSLALVAYGDANPAIEDNNGYIEVTVSGGNAPYKISSMLENKPAGLPAPYDVSEVAMSGNTHTLSNLYGSLFGAVHKVTVTDALGCSVTEEATIKTSSEALIWEMKIFKNDCDGVGGNISVLASGGTIFDPPSAPYRYELYKDDVLTVSNGTGVFPNLVSGTYKVKVIDRNGAEFTNDTIIRAPAIQVGIALNSASTKNDCLSETVSAGSGVIAVTGSGSATPYQYSISSPENIDRFGNWQTENIFSDLLGDVTYRIRIVDNLGCMASTDHHLMAPTHPLHASIMEALTRNDCSPSEETNEGLLVGKASGGYGDYTYSWNTTPPQLSDTAKKLKGSPAGETYVLTVRDKEGCEAEVSGVIRSSSEKLTVTGKVNKHQCSWTDYGEIEVNMHGGLEPYTLQWNDTVEPKGGNVYNVNLFNKQQTHTYVAEVSDILGCKDTAKMLVKRMIEPLRFNALTVQDPCGANVEITVEVADLTGVPFADDGEYYLYHWTDKPEDEWVKHGNRTDVEPATLYTAIAKDYLNCTASQTVVTVAISEPMQYEVAVTPACNLQKGTVTISPTKGTPPYSIQIYDKEGSPVVEPKTGGYLPSECPVVFELDGGDYILDVGDQYALACYSDEQWEANLREFTIPKASTPLTAHVETFKNDCENNFSGSIVIKISGGMQHPVGNKYTVTWDSAGTDMSLTHHNVTAIWDETEQTYTYTIKKLQGRFLNEGGIAYTATITDELGCSVLVRQVIHQVKKRLELEFSTTNHCVQYGTINVTAEGGIPSYYRFKLHEIDGTDTVFLQEKTVGSFTNLSGTPEGKPYTVAVTADLNCPVWTSGIKIYHSAQELDLHTKSTVPVSHICIPGSGTGSITVEAGGGKAPYKYKKGAEGVYAQDSVFSGLLKGGYIFYTIDAYGCEASHEENIKEPSTNEPLALQYRDTYSKIRLCDDTATNGVITVSGSKGTPVSGGYRYKLEKNSAVVQDYGDGFMASKTFSNLGPGTYRVTVKDLNNCEKTSDDIIITGPTSGQALSMTLSKDEYQLCSPAATEGKVTVSAANGSPTYQYKVDDETWSNEAIFDALSVGEHRFRVKDSYDCEVSASAVIEGPTTGNALSVRSRNFQLKACSNGEVSNTWIEIHAQGGSPHIEGEEKQYQYSLDNNTSYGAWEKEHRYEGLSVGSHIVYVRDDRGCESSYSFEVVLNPALLVAVDEVGSQLCVCSNEDFGAYVKVNASGGTPKEGIYNYDYKFDAGTYKESNSEYGLGTNPSPHTVIVRDAVGCTAQTTFNVTLHEGYNLASENIEVCNMSFMEDKTLLTVNTSINDKDPVTVHFFMPKTIHLHYIRADINDGANTQIYATFDSEINADTTVALLSLPPMIPVGSKIVIEGQPYQEGDKVIKWELVGICSKEGEIPVKVIPQPVLE